MSRPPRQPGPAEEEPSTRPFKPADERPSPPSARPSFATELPHAPEVGLARRLLGPFHVTGVFWYRFLLWGVVHLPRGALSVLVPPFTTFFFLTLWRIRAAVASNLEAVLGPAGWWRRQKRIFRTFHQFAWCFGERFEVMHSGHLVEPEIVGLERWREHDGGLILTTAHVGHWEAGSMLAPVGGHRPVHVVREEEMDPEAQELQRELFARHADAPFTFHFARDDPMLGPKLLAALRRGEMVALQSDRPRAGGRTVPAELFGRPFALPTGLFALARAAGVPILPVFVFRLGRNRVQLVFREPIRVERTESRDHDFATAARRLAGEIEWAIRERPNQWFCFRALWP